MILEKNYSLLFNIYYVTKSILTNHHNWDQRHYFELSSFLEIYEDLNDIKENKEFDHEYVDNYKVKNDVEKVMNVMNVTIKLCLGDLKKHIE